MLLYAWTEENIELITLIVVLLIKHAFDVMGRSKSRGMIKDIGEKVNGGLVAAVNRATELGRREHAPRILIVEDDPNDMDLAKRVIKKFDAVTFEATSAREAEELLMQNIGPGRGYPFDFVLLDLKLPGEDANDVFRTFTLRAPKVPLVVLTGHPELGSRADFSGIPRIWIEKPLQVHHVKSLLEQFGLPYRMADLTSPPDHQI